MTSMLVPLFTTPVVEFRELAPVLILFAAAVIGVLVDAFLLRDWRRWRDEIQMGLLIGSSVAALVYVVLNARKGLGGTLAMGSIMLDGPTYVAWGSLLVFGMLAVLVFRERRVNGGVTAFASAASSVPGSLEEAEADRVRLEQTEVYPLALFALTGMMVFVAANDLLTLFVALEVFSLPLYLMCGMARRRRLLSQESSLKYFLLGAFSSGIFLFGVALLYAFAGSFRLGDIAGAVAAPQHGRWLLYAGLVLLVVGLLFKVGVVPFHNWTPDVYVGAPTPVTGFMAICTKLAAIVATLRVLYVALGGERWSWQPMLAVLAVLTMAVGAVAGLTQRDVKRMLAYSSIAHAGFLLTAVVGASQDAARTPTSVSAILFYMVAYGFATIGAFGLVTMVRNEAGEDNSFAAWSGLAKKNPWVAGLMSVFLLSFAGIPLTAGFIGKWAVFAAAWRGGYSWLVVVAVLVSLVAAYFYLRLIVVMFGGTPARNSFVSEASGWTWVPVLIGAAATVLLGVLPDSVLSIAAGLGTFLR